MVESSENILVESSSSSSSQTLPERESDIVMPPTMSESYSTTDTNFNSESEHPTPMTTPTKKLSPTKFKKEVSLPKVQDRIKCTDPDTQEQAEFIILSRAGKVGKHNEGAYKYWLNVKDTRTNTMKSINFEKVTDWEAINTESVYNSTYDSHEVSLAQLDELSKWDSYNVYEEVDDVVQDVISTRWVITQRYENGESHVKACLVARGFENRFTNHSKGKFSIDM